MSFQLAGPTKLWLDLLMFSGICFRVGWGLRAENVIVSTAIDASNWEIQYEALRLLLSLELFGGELRNSKRAVCVSYEEENVDAQLLDDIHALNVTCIDFAKRYSQPVASPSLNKLCSFTPSCMDDDDYLLYLDADVFITTDPLPSLAAYSSKGADILCGRPWNTFPNIQDFHEYLGVPEDNGFLNTYEHLLLTYSGGRTFYGMCNTGVYFMRATIAKRLLVTARLYLEKSRIDPRFRETVPYAPTYFGIDSVILWAAQHTLNFTVQILPPNLNYMVPAEKFITRGFMNSADDCDNSSKATTAATATTTTTTTTTATTTATSSSSYNNNDNEQGHSHSGLQISHTGDTTANLDRVHRPPPQLVVLPLVHLSTGSGMYFIEDYVRDDGKEGESGGDDNVESPASTGSCTTHNIINKNYGSYSSNNNGSYSSSDSDSNSSDNNELVKNVLPSSSNNDHHPTAAITEGTATTSTTGTSPTTASTPSDDTSSTSTTHDDAYDEDIVQHTLSDDNHDNEDVSQPEKGGGELKLRCMVLLHGFAEKDSLTFPLMTRLLDDENTCKGFYRVLRRYDDRVKAIEDARHAAK